MKIFKVTLLTCLLGSTLLGYAYLSHAAGDAYGSFDESGQYNYHSCSSQVLSV
jgi:hypothetical protein